MSEYDESLVERYKDKGIDEKSVEDIISMMKQDGCSIIDTIIVLEDLKGLSNKKAKTLVHYSEHWYDKEDREEKLAFLLKKIGE